MVQGMRINEDIGGWVVIGSEPGQRQMASSVPAKGFRRTGL